MKDIIVEFSGWVRLSPAETKFVKISSLETMAPERINGVKWQQLNEDEQGDYILDDVIDAQRNCDDGDYQQIDWFVDDSP